MKRTYPKAAFDDAKQPRYFPAAQWQESSLAVAAHRGHCFYNGARYELDAPSGDLCRADEAAARRAARQPAEAARPQPPPRPSKSKRLAPRVAQADDAELARLQRLYPNSPEISRALRQATNPSPSLTNTLPVMSLRLTHLSTDVRTANRIRTPDPALTVAATRPIFRLNVASQKLLALTEQSLVRLEYNPEQPRDWYLIKSESASGHRLREAKGNLFFISSTLRQELAKQLPHAPRQTALCFKLAPEPVDVEGGLKAWPLLTAPYWP
jgi:hypothetical protein